MAYDPPLEKENDPDKMNRQLSNMSRSAADKASSHSLLIQAQDDHHNENIAETKLVWPGHPKTLNHGWKARAMQVIWLLPLVVIWVPFVGKQLPLYTFVFRPFFHH